MVDNLSPPPANPVQIDKKFIILYWTKYYHFLDFGNIGLGGKPFVTCDRAGINSGCMATTDRNLLNQSDAVIFHFRTINVSDMPPPEWRRPQQHFIFFEVESPVHTYLPALRWPSLKSYFNRTITYRRDSDVVYLQTHGRLKCINESSSCVDFPLAAKSNIQIDSDPADGFPVNLTLKNRTAAWFVSNCHSDGVGGSWREFLVRNLSQFITVDVYGGCATEEAKKCPNRPACNPMLTQYYRFYLCFENSLCPDYVTEKCYRPLAYDTVPVVYGGSDYSLFFPAGSYINAMDFDSPESLANYLKKLMTDDELYLSYFRWRRKYVVDLAPKDSWCQLCRMLRDPETKSKTYDIAPWWSGELINHTCLLSPPKSLVFT
jgi:alpha-1,3-fucosyltransferase